MTIPSLLSPQKHSPAPFSGAHSYIPIPFPIILSHAPFFKHPASSHPPIFKPSQAGAGAQISSFFFIYFFLGAAIWGEVGNSSTC